MTRWLSRRAHPAGAVPASCRSRRRRAGRRRRACPWRSRALGRARRRRSRTPSSPWSSSSSMCAGSPSLGSRVGAPHAEPVVLRVDPVEPEPLVARSGGPRRCARPSRPPWRPSRTSCPLLPARGGGSARRLRQRGERGGAGTRGCASSCRGVRRDLVEHVRRQAVTRCTTPGWKFGFPSGIGVGHRRRSGPGSSPVRARVSHQQRTSRAVSIAVSRRAPTPMPSCASTIPPGSSSSCSSIASALSPAPVVRVRVPPDDLQAAAPARPPA